MSAVADKLREARALIEPRGAWLQGDFKAIKPSGRHAYCMAGALIEACDGTIPTTVRTTLIQATGGRGLYSFNDAPHRKKAEVLAVFDKAIELAEKSA